MFLCSGPKPSWLHILLLLSHYQPETDSLEENVNSCSLKCNSFIYSFWFISSCLLPSGLAQWIQHCCKLWYRSHSSDLAFLWFWHRPPATAPIRPLAWEPPCAIGVTLDKIKRQKKKKKKRDVGLIQNSTILNYWCWQNRVVKCINLSLDCWVLKSGSTTY